MGFGDLKSQAGIKALNDFLADKSYIEGYVPSQGDAVVFAALAEAPAGADTHALRWYNHIKSYGNDTAKFPGAKKAVTEYGPAGGAQDKKADADDDDFDLFGSDDDDAAEATKLKEERLAAYAAKKAKTAEPAKPVEPPKPAAATNADKKEEEEEDFDLFGSDDEDASAEAEKLKQERVEQYAAKKAKKPTLVAKSSIILDVKPWDDETDMKKMEELVRTIEADGLVWGASKLVPLAYGIRKLQIICIVEDEKIGTDFLEEKITAFEDYVQSVDVAAFNKI